MEAQDNELGIDDYYNLTNTERDSLDDWLRSLGGAPQKTRKLTLIRQDKVVLAEEWITTSNKLLTYNKKTHDVEVRTRELEYKDEPPVWKKINDK